MKPNKRHKTQGTFGSGRGVYITNALRTSLAYQALPPTGRLVLIDMIRAYNAASSGDKASIAGIGFRYTYGDCLELVDSKSFFRARRRICEHGFFIEAVDLKALKAGAPSIYLPSIKWTKYIPADDIAEKLEKRRKRKSAALQRSRDRKAAFIQGKDMHL